MNIQTIINFFQDEHTRIALAFVVAFIGYCYPPVQALCNFAAGFLGVSVGITISRKAIEAVGKP